VAYSELIKNFERIRNYMREFYVYGFKNRGEYDAKSSRSYDNERRRIESWLGEYMSFHQNASGKNVFLSVDSRRIPRNPLYKAFKAKSFTDKDITLHFYILDILADGNACSSKQIVNRIMDEYLSHFDTDFSFDESTVRKKLKEYENIGILRSQKHGRDIFYQRTDADAPNLETWQDALGFYSEIDPMGVVGSYLMNEMDNTSDIFRFKHHYFLHALDSDVLYLLLQAIDEQRLVDLTVRNLRNRQEYCCTICPLKIYISTQTGRQYVLGYHDQGKHMAFYRLDAITKVVLGNIEPNYDKYIGYQKKFDQNLWGVSTGPEYNLDHIEMTIHFDRSEKYILKRLDREKRHGHIEIIDDHTCRFVADVYDASEMIPWLRTFIGRITDLKCSNSYVIKTFYEDMDRMNAMYGGGEDAVQ